MKWRNPAWRKQFIRYWLKDPFWGSLDFIVHYALRYCSINFNAKVGAFLGEISGKYRFKNIDARIKRNLAYLRPDLTEFEHEQTTVKCWRNIGQTMTEFSQLNEIYKAHKITLQNREYLDSVTSKKQAIIFVFAHTGNWELWGNFTTALGLDFLPLCRPERNRFTRKIANRARARMGLTNIVESDNPLAMRVICRQLEAKKSFWIAIDETKDNYVDVPRFGREISLKSSNLGFALRLAQRYDAVILPIWFRREQASNFTIRFDEPLKVAKGEEAFIEAFEKLEQTLEAWILKNIEQWYMLHELRL